ncbi:EamA family transporter RarD [Elongatibacter sediminis]|uniref:EamA family transporter RarD n=1 Tax=Elongatibacter sediminis TaxID=3119006 RepID=A0AAW9RFC3_9GAMM
MNQPADTRHQGVAAALGAFIIWGLAPIFFKWIASVDPLEIIGHRILWSVPMLAGFLLLRDGPGFWRRLKLPLRDILILACSGVLVSANWLIYVWAVNTDRVLSTSLGYFIGPLVYALLGFLFLGERLSRIQTLALGLAGLGTAYLAWTLGVAPWISLGLAFSFGFYALVRKRLAVGPMVGLLWETALLALPALVFIGVRWSDQALQFGQQSLRIDMLLVLCGLITVLPLVWFNLAARSLSLTVIGFLQYLSPTLTFLLAVFFFGEPFTPGHAVAFSCIWTGLLMVTLESVWRSRRARLA